MLSWSEPNGKPEVLHSGLDEAERKGGEEMARSVQQELLDVAYRERTGTQYNLCEWVSS